MNEGFKESRNERRIKESTNERRIEGIYKWTKNLKNLQMNEGFMESTNERKIEGI